MRHHHSAERGVTLIEMMVVVIVIAIMVAISTPSISAGIDSVRLSTATSSVAAFLNTASNRAERRQQPVVVIISTGDNNLQLVSTEAHSGQTLTLPLGISIHPLSASMEDPQGFTRALFMPGGAVPAIALALTNQHGGRRVVRLDPMTGFPRVETANPNEPANPDQ